VDVEAKKNQQKDGLTASETMLYEVKTVEKTKDRLQWRVCRKPPGPGMWWMGWDGKARQGGKL